MQIETKLSISFVLLEKRVREKYHVYVQINRKFRTLHPRHSISITESISTANTVESIDVLLISQSFL